MKLNIKKSLQGLLLVPALAFAVSAVAPVVQPEAVSAQADKIRDGVNATGNNTNTDRSIGDIVTQITNVLLWIIGAVSVIMIIYGGFKYITSGGDSSGVTSAKNTIMYAVIGLLVAVLAYVIVDFVVGSDGDSFLNFS